jgi:hypothetical protein
VVCPRTFVQILVMFPVSPEFDKTQNCENAERHPSYNFHFIYLKESSRQTTSTYFLTVLTGTPQLPLQVANREWSVTQSALLTLLEGEITLTLNVSAQISFYSQDSKHKFAWHISKYYDILFCIFVYSFYSVHFLLTFFFFFMYPT